MAKLDTFSKFTLTKLTKYLSTNFKKEKGGRLHVSPEFTISDVQGYLKRGYLPLYLIEGIKIKIIPYDRCDLKIGKFYQLQEEIILPLDAGSVKVPTIEEKIEEILASDLTKAKKIMAFADLGLTRTEVLKLDFVDPTYVYDMYRYMFPRLCK